MPARSSMESQRFRAGVAAAIHRPDRLSGRDCRNGRRAASREPRAASREPPAASRKPQAASRIVAPRLTDRPGLWHYADVSHAHNSMRLRLSGMTVGLAAGITIAVAAALGGASYVYSLHHFQALIDTARTTALAEGELIRAALEHQMMENDRSLIGRMIESFGREPGVERVVLLDRTGVERYSSVPTAQDSDLKPGSPTCQACHQYPPDRRSTSRVIDTRGGTLLRTVVPFRNRDACHRCHNPSPPDAPLPRR